MLDAMIEVAFQITILGLQNIYDILRTSNRKLRVAWRLRTEIGVRLIEQNTIAN